MGNTHICLIADADDSVGTDDTTHICSEPTATRLAVLSIKTRNKESSKSSAVFYTLCKVEINKLVLVFGFFVASMQVRCFPCVFTGISCVDIGFTLNKQIEISFSVNVLTSFKINVPSVMIYL